MKKITLQGAPRTIVGRKVKQLRKALQIPASIYGKKVPSVSITLTQADFEAAFKTAGQTSLIELQLPTGMRPVLVKNVQVHPVTGHILHVDFYQVDLKQKVIAKVPVKIQGIPGAVTQKLGLLLELVDEVEVEALPTDLPEALTIEVTHLAAIGATIKVSDLKVVTGVEIKTSPETELVKIGALVTREAQEQAKAEEAAKAEAAAAKAEAAPVAPEAAKTGAPATAKPEEKKPA